jgi:hypothetical protein
MRRLKPAKPHATRQIDPALQLCVPRFGGVTR